jgi:hypothetical protein
MIFSNVKNAQDVVRLVKSMRRLQQQQWRDWDIIRLMDENGSLRAN